MELYSTVALEDDETGKDPLEEALRVFSRHGGSNLPENVAAPERTYVND